jgi:hypothetical protein
VTTTPSSDGARTLFRSAVTGRVVSAAYAAENPDTTVAETVAAGEDPDALALARVLEVAQDWETHPDLWIPRNGVAGLIGAVKAAAE